MRCFLLNKYVNNVKKILQHLRQRSGLFLQLFSVGIIPMCRTKRKGFRIRKSSFATKSVRPEKINFCSPSSPFHSISFVLIPFLVREPQTFLFLKTSNQRSLQIQTDLIARFGKAKDWKKDILVTTNERRLRASHNGTTQGRRLCLELKEEESGPV